MRNTMIAVLGSDYVNLARAKGLPPARVALRYAARNALLPSVTGFGMALGFVLGGSLLTEIVFSYPGQGYLLVQAVRNQDYPLMQGIFLVITLAVLGANWLVDVVYLLARPAHPGVGVVSGAGARGPPGLAAWWDAIRRDRKATVGAVAARRLRAASRVVGPWLVGDPDALVGIPLQPPSAQHWLGTTGQGQDVLAQLVVGTRVSLAIGFVVGHRRGAGRRAGRRDRRLLRRPGGRRCCRCSSTSSWSSPACRWPSSSPPTCRPGR